ncbi:MAG TPA: calcium-binding protein [Phenylobacterium sp.]
MPSPSFTFYGVVENADAELPAFQFTNGQHITAHLTLNDAAADAYEEAFEDEGSIFLENDNDIDLTFQGQPMFITEEFYLRSNGTDLSIVETNFIGAKIDGNPAASPGSLFFRVDQFRDGGAVIIEEEGNGDDAPDVSYGRATISGAWLPDDITPNLIYGTAAGETLKATGEVSMIWGMGGNDTITGGSQSFYGWGGNGNDSLRGSGEEDQLWGGWGNDNIQGRGGADMLNGLEGNDTVLGGDGEDTMAGDEGNDSLSGGAEDDFIEGGSGADTIRGDGGDDTLNGIDGADSIDGGAGDDLLDGAWLKGGGGEDTFRFNMEFGSTTVEDFKPGNDTLLLYDSDPGVDMLSFATQSGAHVVFADAGGTFLILRNMTIGQLSESDFDFVF